MSPCAAAWLYGGLAGFGVAVAVFVAWLVIADRRETRGRLL